MININGYVVDLGDPLVIAALVGGVLVLLLFVLLITSVRRAGRSSVMAEQLAQQLAMMAPRVQSLSDGQQQLAGGLTHVSEASAQAQTQMLKLMEERLAKVTENVQGNLSASARNTAQSLGELQQRLKTIDKAQENITKLSGDVLGLQDILSNKQTRGAFGEMQLRDIVSNALPADSFDMQVTLSNGKRADCLIKLPNPPGPIVVDAKFPLEAYEALRAADNERAKVEAARAFKASVRVHIKAISEKYILDGETADGALMFLPSEAVYAELHANFGDVVQDSFNARVWIVSPTTCMATLHTMRAILKDARMREQAGTIRTAIRMLHRDVEMVGERVEKLNTHFRQAREDVEGIGKAAERAGKRASKIDDMDFGEAAQEVVDSPRVVAIMRNDS